MLLKAHKWSRSFRYTPCICSGYGPDNHNNFILTYSSTLLTPLNDILICFICKVAPFSCEIFTVLMRYACPNAISIDEPTDASDDLTLYSVDWSPSRALSHGKVGSADVAVQVAPASVLATLIKGRIKFSAIQNERFNYFSFCCRTNKKWRCVCSFTQDEKCVCRSLSRSLDSLEALMITLCLVNPAGGNAHVQKQYKHQRFCLDSFIQICL